MTRFLIQLMTVVLLLVAGGAASAEAIIDSDFNFKYVRQDKVRLSPDGEYIAVVTKVPAQSGAHNLVTMRLSDGLAKAITGFSDSDVGSFFWASEQRLIFSTDKASDEAGGVRVYRGSYTIGRDGGSGGRKLYQQRVRKPADGQSSAGTPPQLLHRLPNDWKNVLITRTDPSSVLPEVFLMNSDTGRSKRVVSSKFQITQWFADNHGYVRAALDQGGDVLDGRERLLYRDKPGSQWREVATYGAGDLSMLAFNVDNRALIVLARIEQDGADDRQGLYLIDSDGQRLRLLVSDPVYNVGNLSSGAAGLKQTGQGHLVYYQYMADGLRTVYFDPRWGTRQELIDEALADTVNTIVDWSDDERKLLILARDEKNTGEYYVFDTTQQELKYLEPPSDWVKTPR